MSQLNIGPTWTVNLLHNETFYRYLRDSAQFRPEALEKVATRTTWILLDEVHSLLEATSVQFVLSGSGARKLKRGGANLLGGGPFAGPCTRVYSP